MIFTIPRHLLFLLFFTLVICLEHSLGLPIISLVLASLYLARTERVFKTIGLFVCGGLLAVSYLIPFWGGIGAVASLLFFLERRYHFLHSETITFMSATLVVAIFLGVLAKIPVTTISILYHFLLLLVSVFFIRWWFIKNMGKRQEL